jgi:hypothetical protein
MWLPVRVVTAEDDLFVTEASGKGLYGAIDWWPLAYSHVKLVKPSEINNDRYLAAKSFLRICRTAPNQVVLDRIWHASQDIWRSRELRVSGSLNFNTVIGEEPVAENAKLSGFSVCHTSCQYDCNAKLNRGCLR